MKIRALQKSEDPLQSYCTPVAATLQPALQQLCNKCAATLQQACSNSATGTQQLCKKPLQRKQAMSCQTIAIKWRIQAFCLDATSAVFYRALASNSLGKRQKESRKYLYLRLLIFKLINDEMTYQAFTPLYSSETVSFFLPLARRAANTLRPFAVAILSRKPCLFFLFLLEG